MDDIYIYVAIILFVAADWKKIANSLFNFKPVSRYFVRRTLYFAL